MGPETVEFFLYLSPPNPAERSRRVFVDNLERLAKFCTSELGVPMGELMYTNRIGGLSYCSPVFFVVTCWLL